MNPRSLGIMFVLNMIVLLTAFVVLDDRTWSGTGLGKIIGYWLPYAVAVSLVTFLVHYFIEKRCGQKDKP